MCFIFLSGIVKLKTKFYFNISKAFEITICKLVFEYLASFGCGNNCIKRMGVLSGEETLQYSFQPPL